MIHGRIVLAVDVSNWLRPDAHTSPDRLFCHTYGRGRGSSQMIPGWPYSFVAALEPRQTSWTTILDVIRLRPYDDEIAVTAAQIREVVQRLRAAGHWTDGGLPVPVVVDAGYDVTRLAFLLAGLPVELLGRIRSDRVPYFPPTPQPYGKRGRKPKRGPESKFEDATTWPAPVITTVTETTRYGLALASAWGQRHPLPVRRSARSTIPKVNYRSSQAQWFTYKPTTCPGTEIPSRCGCGGHVAMPLLPMWTGSGNRFCGDSILNIPSECSSRPSAGPLRNFATRPRRTAGPGWSSPPIPNSASPGPWPKTSVGHGNGWHRMDASRPCASFDHATTYVAPNSARHRRRCSALRQFTALSPFMTTQCGEALDVQALRQAT
ncbi:transposase [Streptomyces sp. NPDC054771]